MNFWIVFAFSTYIQGITTDGNILDFSHVRYVEMGKNTNITCNIAKNAGNLQWYKEREDGGLQGISRSGCHNQNKDIKYHVHCENMSVHTMEIRNINLSDSGVYYCSLSGLDQTFHLAITLIVTESHPKTPTLLVLESVEDHPSDTDSIVLLCVVLDWTKEWDEIKWTINGTEKKGWLTLDTDGSLRSLYVMSKTSQHSNISCYIKKSTSNGLISSSFTIQSTEENDKGERSIYECYIVLYVGLPIIIAILLIHQIILAFRRRTLSKDTPPPVAPQEHHVRFSPQEESVTYAAVRS